MGVSNTVELRNIAHCGTKIHSVCMYMYVMYLQNTGERRAIGKKLLPSALMNVLLR